MNNCWHLPDLSVLEKQLNTDLSDGLSAREARNRLERERKNNGEKRSIFVAAPTPFFKGAFTFASSPFLILLTVLSLITAVIALVSKDSRGFLVGLSVLCVTVAVALVGSFLNYRARRRLDSMREYASPMVKVKRGGNLMHTDGRNLVAGDIIVLRTGDLLPCDARVLKSNDLQVEELVASDNGLIKRRVTKRADVSYSADDKINTPNVENMLYAGSAVVSGGGIALVCAVGEQVYLAPYIPDGALGGRDSEPEGVKNLRSVCHKISFLCASALLILSLLGLLTLRGKESFICEFLALASAICFVTAEMLSGGATDILTHYIKRLSSERDERAKRKNASAAVRNIKSLDILSGIDELVLLGRVGLSEGSFHFTSAYTANGTLDALTPDTKEGVRLLTLLHTYAKSLRESGVSNTFVEEGYLDAAFQHLKSCGFDINGASLAIRSLYFAADTNQGSGFACAETDSELYRTSFFFSEELFQKCKLICSGGSVREILPEDREKINDYRTSAREKGYKCIFAVSESDGKTVFEGIVSLNQIADTELDRVIPALRALNVHTTVFLGKEGEQTDRLINDAAFRSLFNGEIAYASDFASAGKKITDGCGSYCAYVGFGGGEYAELISYMRSHGSRVAAYGICNDYNPIMARADIAVSCDVIRYSSDKYRESVYEKMPPEGRENNVRCSQQTRLLSKVIVRRFNEKGGGMASLLNVFRMSRSAYVSFGLSLYLFVMLMCPMLVFSAMTVLTGNVLLDPFQTVALSAITAIFSMSAFTDSEFKDQILSQKRDYTGFATDLLFENRYAIIARAAVPFVSAIAIKILDLLRVFGEDSSFTLPIYICVMFTGFAEVFLLNRAYTKPGEGRGKCWLKVVIAYALLLSVCAVATTGAFMDAFFANGIGSKEFFIIPAYIALYLITAFAVKYFVGKRK